MKNKVKNEWEKIYILFLFKLYKWLGKNKIKGV